MARKNNELLKVERELKKIEQNLEKYPGHFSGRDIVNAFFGALIFSLTFIFKGNFLEMSFLLPWSNVLMVISANILVLIGETYFIGYKRVIDKRRRPLLQFMAKRVVTFYAISLVVSAMLIHLFNMDSFAATEDEVRKLLFILTMPSSMGAAIANLVKKYY